MSRKLSLTLGFGEREESILAYAEDDFDDWSDHPTSRWRNSCPDQKSTATASRWGSRLTSLSAGLIGAGTALTTRAKQLCAGDSTHRAINQLRRSMVEVSSSRTERSLRGSTPTQHRFSESDIDCFKDVEAQPEAEKAGDDECAHGKKCPKCALPSRGGKLKRLESSRSWTQGCS